MSDARLRRLERAALHDPDAAARLEDARARLRPRLLPAVRSELLDGDGIAGTTVAALLNGFEVVNRRDFLSPGFVPQTRRRGKFDAVVSYWLGRAFSAALPATPGPVEWQRPGLPWIDPVAEARADQAIILSGVTRGRPALQEAVGDLRALDDLLDIQTRLLGLRLGVPDGMLRGDWQQP